MRLIVVGLLSIVAFAGCIGGPGSEPPPSGEPLTIVDMHPAEPVEDIGPLESRLGPEPIRVPEPYRIRAADVLEISIVGDEALTTKTIPVGPDGRISYNIARVYAAGKTFEELSDELQTVLKKHYKDPVVTIVGREFAGNSVTILGVVRSPGRFPISSDTRLMDALALAGGIPLFNPATFEGSALEISDLTQARLIRGNRKLEIDFEALFSGDARRISRNNIIVQANDTIVIPSAASLDNKVIVLGAVTRPGLYRFKKSISLMEAVALSGGPTIKSWERMAIVVRGSMTNPQIIPVNTRLVAQGRERNVLLAGGDILYFPTTPLGKMSEIVQQIFPAMNTVELGNRVYQSNR
jgi:polysaccharide export outer membrane protein